MKELTDALYEANDLLSNVSMHGETHVARDAHSDACRAIQDAIDRINERPAKSYARTMDELIAERAKRTLTQNEESWATGKLDECWDLMTEEEQQAAEAKYSTAGGK